MAVAGLLAASAAVDSGAPAPAPRAAPAEAVAPASDTTLRVPGTMLRFGTTLAQVQRRIRTEPASAGAAAPGTVVRQARVRFFGLDSDATLDFQDGVLARASFSVAGPSPHDIDFVEDELARQGFRRSCEQREGLDRRCDWTARARVRLTTSATQLQAEAEPLAPPAPAPLRAAAAPETLWLTSPGALESQARPQVRDSCRATRPAAAQSAGVFGRVLVEALVDTSGAVIETRIARSVALLDSTALACARRYRFEPYRRDGRPVRFWVQLLIRFTL